MKYCPQLFLIALSLNYSSCATQEPNHTQTFADVEAEVAHNAAHYQQSQLTKKPDKGFDNAELSFSLFFKLPLQERVVYIMNSFAQVELDGEYAERMYAMLCNRTKPNSWRDVPYPPTAEDKSYTQAIFQTIDSYSEGQLRSFCMRPSDFARFEKNLKTWRDRCNCAKKPNQALHTNGSPRGSLKTLSMIKQSSSFHQPPPESRG